jgi:hypothetical protein
MIIIKSVNYPDIKKQAISSLVGGLGNLINSEGFKTIFRGTSTLPVLQTINSIGENLDLDVSYKVKKYSKEMQEDFLKSTKDVNCPSELNKRTGGRVILKMLKKYIDAGRAATPYMGASDPTLREIVDLLENLSYARDLLYDIRGNRTGTGTAFGAPTKKGTKIEDAIYSSFAVWLPGALDGLNSKFRTSCPSENVSTMNI